MHQYTEKELDELSVSLRVEKTRLNFPNEEIENIVQFIESKIDECKQEEDYKLCSSSLKVLVNYVADVVENCDFIYGLIKDTIPTNFNKIMSEDLGSYSNWSSLEFFVQVQLILINNMLTTNRKVFEKDHCSVIFKRLLNIHSVFEWLSTDVDDYLVLEILQDIHSILDKIDVNDFLKLRQLCLEIGNDNTGDDEILEMTNSVLLRYSGTLICDGIDNTKKIEIFRDLYSSLKNKVDEQVLLNVVFEMNIDSEEFYKELVEIIFDKQTGEFQIEEHIPAMILLLSNQITNEKAMKEFIGSISIESMVEYYFKHVYPSLTLKYPWELQSIALLNKIPLDYLKNINGDTINNYLNQLATLITSTTLQINVNVVILQMTFLGKLFGSIDNTHNKQLIDGFLSDIKLSNEYEGFPYEFKIILNQVYFQYLYTHKVETSNDELKNILQKTLEESYMLLNDSIENRVPIQMIYLIELSKIFGFYVGAFANEKWFKQAFETFERIFEEANGHMKQNVSQGEAATWKILENNIQYTRGVMNK